MNILFLTLVYPEGENASNIYVDLMKDLKSKGSNIYVATSMERNNKKETFLSKQQDIDVLRIKTGNIQKTSIIEKGISTLLIEYQFISAIKKYFSNVKFDLVVYSTPPITFAKVINYVKDRDEAKSYLLLKDIFPQNAVDMGIIKENSILHRFFKSKEKSLYISSDYIGCMSDGNKQYLLKNNSYLDCKKVEVCPNSILPNEIVKVSKEEKNVLREKFGIPNNALVVIYGGNLGKPQGIDFLIEVIEANKNKDKVFFLIIGSGTEYFKLEKYMCKSNPNNAKLYPYLPKDEYNNMIKISDMGLIFLDRRFTIPNFPSRLLSYMEYSLPILSATDINTDIGQCIKEGNFGEWCESGDIETFNLILHRYINDRDLLNELGSNSRRYLEENYTVDRCSKIILKHFKMLWRLNSEDISNGF